MQKHSSVFITRACSLVVTLALMLSVVIIPASAVNASAKDMNPTDDPLLGTQFAVDAVIPLVSTGDGKDISLTVPVQGVDKDALEAAVAAGQVSVALNRDETRPYVNEKIYPNQYDGGALDDWKTQKADENEFTDLQLSVAESDGAVVLNVSFHVNNYFYNTNRSTGEVTSSDYSVPHVAGGYYLDLCGYFNLTAQLDGNTIGTAPVKVAPYENFSTMWEI